MSDPNTWASATVVNEWGSQITDVYLDHRYDEDHFDKGHWNFIDNGKQGDPSFAVGYWTGFLRTGKDYWVVRFTDSKGGVWTNKPNFYCFLTADDANKLVKCRVKDQTLYIEPASSSSCSVALYRIGMGAQAAAE
jgi:hypothetical protein